VPAVSTAPRSLKGSNAGGIVTPLR
jgi:hypothetical protein